LQTFIAANDADVANDGKSRAFPLPGDSSEQLARFASSWDIPLKTNVIGGDQ
jgi:hypothetical protein